MKKLTYLSFFTMLSFLFACHTVKVLSLKNKPGYTEYHLIANKAHTELKQIINYRTPVLDGSFSYILNFSILDSAKWVNKKQLHFPADTTIVKPKFDISSVWNWEEEKYTLKGDFTLLNWTDSSMLVKEVIDVYDPNRKEHFVYRGKRVFTKQ